MWFEGCKYKSRELAMGWSQLYIYMIKVLFLLNLIFTMLNFVKVCSRLYIIIGFEWEMV